MTINIHSIESMGALDGPGLRTIFFLKGCPLRCLYCHNADMLSFEGGEKWTIDDLVKEAKKFISFYGDDGGVTISGSEPLAQGKAVLELIKRLKKESIHTCIDTSGAPFNKEILSEVDMVLLDIKHTDKDKYQELVSYKMEDMIKTLEFLQTNKKRFWIRQVIVYGFTQNEAQVKKLKEMSKGAEKIELLPYHAMGVKKWKAAGLEYKLEGVKPPTEKAMLALRKIIE